MTHIALSRMLAIAQLAVSVPAAGQMQQHSHERPVQASSLPADVAVLLDSARKATATFTDRRVAIANGYRLVGRDLPSMGEHWLNTRLLIDGIFDISQPELLTYVKVDGRAVLTGVVYAIPLRQGQSPPSALGPDAVWHEHNGAVDDEALLPEHHNTSSAVSGTRVAFVHAWLRVPHPDGLFAAENWAMPFVRAGLPVPEKYPAGAARALGLLHNGRRFFSDLLGTEASLAAAGALDACATLAAKLSAAARSSGRGLTTAELDQLDTAWRRLLKDVASQSGIETMKRINGGSGAH